MYALVVRLIASALSWAACIWFCIVYWNAADHLRRRLFPRQLLHLALADGLLATATAVKAVYQHLEGDSDAVLQLIECFIFLGLCVSNLVEFHLALGICGTFRRWTRILYHLDWSLPFMWLLGVLFAPLNVYVLKRQGEYWFEVTLILVCFVASVGFYLHTAYFVWRDPESVQKQIWRTVWLYVPTSLVTYGPIVLYVLLDKSWEQASIFAAFAIAFESLNGLANTLTYAINSRVIRAKIRSAMDFSDLSRPISAASSPSTAARACWSR